MTFSGDFSDEHGERFHQEISYMEHRYKGKQNTAHMLGSYINSIIHSKSDLEHSRRNYGRKFCI
jgi:hypothetical protein